MHVVVAGLEVRISELPPLQRHPRLFSFVFVPLGFGANERDDRRRPELSRPADRVWPRFLRFRTGRKGIDRFRRFIVGLFLRFRLLLRLRGFLNLADEILDGLVLSLSDCWV